MMLDKKKLMINMDMYATSLIIGGKVNFCLRKSCDNSFDFKLIFKDEFKNTLNINTHNMYIDIPVFFHIKDNLVYFGDDRIKITTFKNYRTGKEYENNIPLEEFGLIREYSIVDYYANTLNAIAKVEKDCNNVCEEIRTNIKHSLKRY